MSEKYYFIENSEDGLYIDDKNNRVNLVQKEDGVDCFVGATFKANGPKTEQDAIIYWKLSIYVEPIIEPEVVIDPQTVKSLDLKQAENEYLKITKQLCELAGDTVTEYKKLTDAEYTEKAGLASIANPMVTIQLMMSLSYQFTQIKLKAMRDGGMNAEQTAWDNIAFHPEIE